MTDSDMRDLINHVMMFGNSAVVRKMGRKWFIDFRGFGFPCGFSTKKEAMEKVSDWTCMLSMKRRGLI